jgi:hypothetical protein
MQDFNDLPANCPDPDATDSFMQDFFDNAPDNSDPADADTSMLSAGQHDNTSSEAGDLSHDRHSKENNNGDPDSSSEDSESSSNSETIWSRLMFRCTSALTLHIGRRLGPA